MRIVLRVGHTDATFMQTYSLGGKKDAFDSRDHWYDVPSRFTRSAPRRVDLRRAFPPIYHQGKLESCSANAVAAMMWFHALRHRDDRAAIRPSRLFIYYNSRRLGRCTRWNTPVSLRNVYRAIRKWGACPEHLWRYDPRHVARRPPEHCYAASDRTRVVKYERIKRDLTALRACLAEGLPFTFGMSLFDSFYTTRALRTVGAAPMPTSSEGQRGGHAVLAVGYDDRRQRFIVRNSWGARWGDGGYFTLPYEFFEARIDGQSLAWDFWTLRDLSSPGIVLPSSAGNNPPTR